MPPSYAETDCAHSDSDSDDCQHRPEAKRKSATKSPQHVWARTAPISIPSSSRPQLPSHLCESVSESPNLSYHADVRLLQASRYIDEANYAELDEDDPVFYGNLAFFRSQHGVQPTQQTTPSAHSLKLEAAPASPTGVDAGPELSGQTTIRRW
uniref:Uncharacterized protein n=1 Tax=Hyaloperonospora arabidopsidis (strain Emoy2) TaxID=559515 RepID=M4BYW7_HYAAE